MEPGAGLSSLRGVLHLGRMCYKVWSLFSQTGGEPRGGRISIKNWLTCRSVTDAGGTFRGPVIINIIHSLIGYHFILQGVLGFIWLNNVDPQNTCCVRPIHIQCPRSLMKWVIRQTHMQTHHTKKNKKQQTFPLIWSQTKPDWPTAREAWQTAALKHGKRSGSRGPEGRQSLIGELLM